MTLVAGSDAAAYAKRPPPGDDFSMSGCAGAVSGVRRQANDPGCARALACRRSQADQAVSRAPWERAREGACAPGGSRPLAGLL
jgi:hypothetical protein